MAPVADGPTLADWLQGWGTVGGTVFAALAAVAAVAVLMHDRAVRRADEADTAAAQARAVIVLVNAKWDEPQVTDVWFTLRNFSNSVILDIRFGYRYRDSQGRLEGGEFRREYLAPGESTESEKMRLDQPVQAWDTLPAGVIPPDLFPTRVIFTDAAGRRWRRDGRAQPVRFGPEDEPDITEWARRG